MPRRLPLVPLLLSAKADGALAAQAARYAGRPPTARPSPARPRLVVGGVPVAAGPPRVPLVRIATRSPPRDARAAGRPASTWCRPRDRRAGGVPVLRPGRAAAGMGRELYRRLGVRGGVRRGVRRTGPHLPRPLRDVLFGPDEDTGGDLLDQTDFTQAGLFAIEVALFRLLESLGRAAGPGGRPLDR